MKYFQNNLLVFLFFSFVIVNDIAAQAEDVNPMSFDIYRIYPAISFTKEDFNKAKTIIDINDRFKPEWVKKYISVDITAFKHGKSVKASNKNEVLSNEQIDLINSADLDTEIAVSVKYIPDNTLSHNDVQEERFRFRLDPEVDAQYIGDREDMLQYIKQSAVDKIPSDLFGVYHLSAVTFTVEVTGKIVDVAVALSCENEEVNKLLYETVCNIGKWKPAEFANGTKVKQDYVLTVGNIMSCNTNLINIRRGPMYDNEVN